jgi:protease I
MSKVLIPIGDATEVLDTLYPVFRLPEDGFEAVVAGPQARHYHGVMHEIPPAENIPWDMTFDADRRSFDAYRRAKPGKQPIEGDLATLTEEDEHAI